MPTRPLTRCTVCKRLHPDTGMCQACARASDKARGSANRRGYGTRHRTHFRSAVLATSPVCVLCLREPATVADHWPVSRRDLVAQGADPDDPRHGRGLCSVCHGQATAELQPGGWNRRQ